MLRTSPAGWAGGVHSFDLRGLNGGISAMVSGAMLKALAGGPGVIGVVVDETLADGVLDALSRSLISSLSYSLIFSSISLDGSCTRLWLGETENRPMVRADASSGGDGVVADESRLASRLAHSSFAISIVSQSGLSGMAQVMTNRRHSTMC